MSGEAPGPNPSQIPDSPEEFRAVQGARGILEGVHPDAQGHMRTAEGHPIARDTVDALEDLAVQPTYAEVLSDTVLTRERRMQAPETPEAAQEDSQDHDTPEKDEEPELTIDEVREQAQNARNYLQRVEDGDLPDGLRLKRDWSDSAAEHERKQQEYVESNVRDIQDELARHERRIEAVEARERANTHADEIRKGLDEQRVERDARNDMFDKEIYKLRLQHGERYVELNRDELEREVQARVDAAFAKEPEDYATPPAAASPDAPRTEPENGGHIDEPVDGSADNTELTRDYAKARDEAILATIDGNVDKALEPLDKAVDALGKSQNWTAQKAYDEKKRILYKELGINIDAVDTADNEADSPEDDQHPQVGDVIAGAIPEQGLPAVRARQAGTFRNRIRAIREAGTTIRKDESGNRDVRGALGNLREAVTGNPRPKEVVDSTTESDHRHPRMARIVGAGLLSLALVTGGAAGYAIGENQEKDLPKSVQREADKHDELEEAGIGDEALRTHIIHNQDDWERMTSTEEGRDDFARMVDWRDTEIEHRVNVANMQAHEALNQDGQTGEVSEEQMEEIRAQATHKVDKQLENYFEDLDDNEAD